MNIELDYPINPKPRWTPSKPNKALYDVIKSNEGIYRHNLSLFLQFKEEFQAISRDLDPENPSEPNWLNGFIPGLDAVALYGFLCLNNPKQYLEVGSGNSTKFARKAILDNHLQTKITSIDPYPRAEIDQICDEIIRKPVENVDIALFEGLEAGDILFVDNSHRVFTNSDVTVIFLDVLPCLKPGVLVEFHDIFLPYDYPEEWNARYYSEQYMLGAYLLGGGKDIEIILPNCYISNTPGLHCILSPIWDDPSIGVVETHGGSFWIVKK